ncbi:MAG: hypothetical protein MPK62_01955 [Alphaproteobacteria bacterium]|nr:hypothetical protein [Alphaproteobacteria bacterium]
MKKCGYCGGRASTMYTSYGDGSVPLCKRCADNQLRIFRYNDTSSINWDFERL